MKTAYVVLGMHRSGTSSVAGALVQLGGTAPLTLMSAKPENPKGFWESERIMAFNDRLLSACGSSWSDWRTLDAARLTDLGSDPALRDEALALVGSEFGHAERIVLKDPRMCRLFGFWAKALEHAGYRPVVITPFRDPTEVAASLSARNEMSLQFGVRLWLQHVLSAERDTRGYPRHFVAWDDFLGDWRGEIATMAERLSEPFTLTPAVEAALADFLVLDLKHHVASTDEGGSALPAEVHRALFDLARGGDQPAVLDRLDAQRRAFDDISRLFTDAP